MTQEEAMRKHTRTESSHMNGAAIRYMVALNFSTSASLVNTYRTAHAHTAFAEPLATTQREHNSDMGAEPTGEMQRT
jgi:hypothetical protein